MKRSAGSSLPEGIRVLTEGEIRSRLYGEYLGRPKKESAARAPQAPTASSEGSAWTGAEILSAELKYLRSELISLRREQENLQRQLQHRERLTQSPTMAVPPKAERGNLWGAFIGVAVFAAGLMGPLSFRFLQATPQVVGERGLYTIQVAVYDVGAMARQAVGRLNQMGYPVFLVPSSRRNGQPRYNIFLGRFVTKEEAEKERQRLTADPRFTAFTDAFVRVR